MPFVLFKSSSFLIAPQTELSPKNEKCPSVTKTETRPSWTGFIVFVTVGQLTAASTNRRRAVIYAVNVTADLSKRTGITQRNFRARPPRRSPDKACQFPRARFQASEVEYEQGKYK